MTKENKPHHCSRMKQYLGEEVRVAPLITPPELKGKEVIYKKNGVVTRTTEYDANAVHPCYCGCIYDIIDCIDNPVGDSPIYRHRHIRTGEWSECTMILEPMQTPASILFLRDYEFTGAEIETEPHKSDNDK